jgi:hypothetical protein
VRVIEIDKSIFELKQQRAAGGLHSPAVTSSSMASRLYGIAERFHAVCLLRCS